MPDTHTTQPKKNHRLVPTTFEASMERQLPKPSLTAWASLSAHTWEKAN